MWVTWAFKQGRTQHRQSIVQMRWYKWVRQKLNDGIRKFPFMVVNKVNIIWHLLTNNATWSHHLSWLSNTNPRYFCSVVVSRVNSLSDCPVLCNSVNNFWHLFPTQSTDRCSPLLSSSLQSSSLTFDKIEHHQQVELESLSLLYCCCKFLMQWFHKVLNVDTYSPNNFTGEH